MPANNSQSAFGVPSSTIPYPEKSQVTSPRRRRWSPSWTEIKRIIVSGIWRLEMKSLGRVAFGDEVTGLGGMFYFSLYGDG